MAITTTGGCSVSSGAVSMTSGSTACVVHFNQAGNANYNAAPEVLANVIAQASDRRSAEVGQEFLQELCKQLSALRP